MFDKIQPFHQTLDNGLILKSISTEEEIDKLAIFNELIHEEAIVAQMTRTLIRHHPSTHPKEWIFIEDPSTGQIVSSLCLIPWVLRYDTVELHSAEMGIVGTLPEYRRRGLIRSLNHRFQQLLIDGNYVLSHIQGIPYYYRQFGYEYTLPLEGGWELTLHNIPSNPPEYIKDYTFRKAILDDIPLLQQFYNTAMDALDISTIRNQDIWHYLISQEDNLQGMQEVWLILDKNNVPIGYVRTAKEGFRQGLIVDEASQLSHQASIAAMYYFKQMAIERKKPYIRFSMSELCLLVRIAKNWDAQSPWQYAWQIKTPNAKSLLDAIAPILEKRINNSPFANLTQSITFDLYRQSYEVIFDNGQVTSVKILALCESPSMRTPPPQFIQLVLGYKSREELEGIYPDVSVSGQNKYLVDVLFPKMNSFLHLIY